MSSWTKPFGALPFLDGPAGPPTRSKRLLVFGCGLALELELPSRNIARGAVGTSVRLDLFGWLGEGDRADADRFCEGAEEGKVCDKAC